MTSGPVRRLARAKLNVFLRVLRAREDGYHDVESLVVPLDLADEVTVTSAERLRVEVAGAPRMTGDVPAGGLNLALVAALALAEACEVTDGAEIRIEKRIPVAGGLGGGSADAAAALSALDELWGCGLDVAALERIAARVGSDVPATLAGRPVLVSGRGDRLSRVDVPPLWWVLVPMPFGVRSPDAYRWWDEGSDPTGPDPEALLEAARAGDPERIGPLLFNDLEAAVSARHPAIADAKADLLAKGALGAVMSGSGSTVAGLASDARHASALAARFEGATPTHGPPADPAPYHRTRSGVV
jgi:4-diphosphocytidyl-2-C-methyl-D-erythritol kinase